ncbi:FAS1-like dehydratase domain-containing protein [Emcibacter nanhaiensis]|uniref:Acyl dehydratase n=1 Tax=Emcibacter nanhaiensis TaxID=1505037 RepID=A0A501PIU6_9PROT|nr:MaoC family dehydratase N-terminal domain-containing protein [Emcibacter nanhaiensis]TPD60135.1 acyl dehydratase [Emcibacter nanhaiensis]
MSENRFPKITEEGLADLRSRIGVKIENTIEPWNYEASRDAIRHYAHGIGDDNPLWNDPEYAQNTKYGDVIALPSFLFTTSRIISGYCGGLSGVHAMWAGADWNWHKPVMRNDVIRTEAHLKDLIEHQTKFAGRAFQQIYHVDFYNQNDELVADADSWVFRTDRDEARERGTKYTEVRGKVEPFTDEQLAEWGELYANEEIRGVNTRYWEDVTEGEALPRMMKGPMTVTGFICYAQGWGGLYIRANKLAWKMQQAHPGLAIKNRFNVPDCPERVHWDEAFALEVGAPGAYDYGPERTSWLTHHITNWMSDEGFLRKTSCQIRRHNPDGDVIFIDGTVKRKYVEDGKHLVEIEQKAVTHRDELSASGTSIVELPSRG